MTHRGSFRVVKLFWLILECWMHDTMYLSKSTDKDVVKGIAQLKAKGTVQNDHCIN